MSYLAITVLAQPEGFLLLNKTVFIIVMKLLPHTVKYILKVLFVGIVLRLSTNYWRLKYNIDTS